MPSSPRPAGRPAKRPSPPAHHGNHPTPRLSTSSTRRGTGRGDSVLALLVSSLIVPCIRRRRILSAGAFHPGEAAIPGEVIYSAPFSSAHLIHPGSSPHPSHGSPSHPGKQAGRARRRAVIGGSRHRHRIPAPSRLRPGSPLVSACGAKNVSFPSVPCRHRARASPHRSPWLKRFNHSSARARSHPGQTSRQGRPVPVPPLVSAGGKSSANAPRIDRRGVPRGPVIGTAG